MNETLTGREVLRLIGEGAEPEAFQMHDGSEDNWSVLDRRLLGCLLNPHCMVRRKPKPPRTRVVNGFTVPAPEVDAPKTGDAYWLAHPPNKGWACEGVWYQTDATYSSDTWLSRGLVFLTREAAVANAKAMCGIDPEKD